MPNPQIAPEGGEERYCPHGITGCLSCYPPDVPPTPKDWRERYDEVCDLVLLSGGRKIEMCRFITELLVEERETTRYNLLNQISRKMKIAAIIKPDDRTGLLVWLDDQTLAEDEEINLISGKELKEILNN
jgi:hypothetical protein